MNMYFDKPNKYNWTAIIILWLLMLVFAWFLPGCSGKKGYEKYKRNHPEVLAKYCAEKFPPVIRFLPGKTDTIPGDTIFVKGDSIPCPDGTKVKAPDKPAYCPPSYRRVDTVQVTDSAKLFLLNTRINKLYADSIKHTTVIASQKEDIKKLKKDKTLITISGAMLFMLSAFLVFRRFFG